MTLTTAFFHPRFYACARRMALQHGLISYDQALAEGLTANQLRYRVRKQEWLPVLPRVFRHAASSRSWIQDVTAAYLWAGEGSYAFRRTAAALLGFEGFDRDGRVELAAPRRLASPCGWVMVSEVHAPKADLARCSGIPVTTPARTLFDLATILDEEALEDTLDWLLRHGQSIARVRRTADRLRTQGRTGSAAIGRLLTERMPGYVPTQSKLETRLARVIDRSRLPPPVRQHSVTEEGKHVARPDFAYPEAKIAIEAVGYDPHGGRVRQQRDITRRNALVKRGWIVLEFTWRDVTERPEQVIATIAATLTGRRDLVRL